MILRLLGLVLIQFIGCNNQLSQSKGSIESNTSKMATIAHTIQPCGSGQVWDMILERCVDICKTDDCCTNVDCPEGTECVEGLGVCGVPIGNGVYTIGYGWWTGKSANFSDPINTAERPVEIKVINKSTDTIFLKANYLRKAMVEISSTENAQPISIPENYFCPNWCPDKGMPMELDCGRPQDRVIALVSGESTLTQWSGLEVFDVMRYNANSGSKACVQKGQTVPGNYEIKVCAYKEYDAAAAKKVGESGLFLGQTKGSPTCVSSILQFPNKTTIEIVIE